MIIDDLYGHDFYKKILNDVEPYTKGVGFADMGFIVDDDISDLEHYIRYTSFYSIHLISLCSQIERSVSLLSNYNYSRKNEVGRGYHLSYNIENYFIRIDSLYDRVLQVINAVFSLGFQEHEVKKHKILSKLKKYSELCVSLDSLGKILNEESDNTRNTIVHRHSYMDKDLSIIEMYYDPFFSSMIMNEKDENIVDNFKQIRKEFLSSYLKKKKEEFKGINEKCFQKVYLILTELEKEYTLKKQKLTL